MTDTERRGRGGRDEGERDLENRKRDMQNTQTHTHAHLCSLTQWFGQWIIRECMCSSNPSLLDATALFNLTRPELVCAHDCVCVCLCGSVCACMCIWCKALYCAQSGAPILSQWARAKALDDPDLTKPLPPCQCVYVCE